MFKGVVKNSINFGVTARVRPMVPCLVRGFTTNSSGNNSNNNSGPDHSNFQGVKNSGNTADHSNFNGPKQGIPVANTNMDSEALMRDAANKHRIAAQTGDLTMEIQARVEQSMADRIRNHDRPNQGIQQSQRQTSAQQSQQTRSQLNSDAQEVAQILKFDASVKQSLGDRFDDDFLKDEARMEQSMADSILRGSRQNTQNKLNQATQTPQSKLDSPPDIEFHVGDKTLHTPYELKMDAAQKQSVAARTHDQALMDEARLEQRVADALSPNPRGQPLYGQGPSGHIRPTGQQPQQRQQQNQQATPQKTATQQTSTAASQQASTAAASAAQQVSTGATQQNARAQDDEPFDIYEELTLELSDEYPSSLEDALRAEDAKRL